MTCLVAEITTGLFITGSAIVVALSMFSGKDKNKFLNVDLDMQRAMSRRTFCKKVIKPSSIDLNKKNDT